jgi:GT2 family glycosyltransferase
MTQPPVSVVVVSRGRPAALTRCLTGLSQLQYQPFEIVVVADPAGIAAARALLFVADLKLVEYDEPNISEARNRGIAQSAGELVAFIDDDAVPEPQWLRHLAAPAARPEVAAMGGFVRGRNGISFQWTARSLDALGEAHSLEVDPQRATVLHPPKGRAIKTEGTNMAFRRSVLVELGGFDPAFHYFLDETDLNMRLARAGHATAIVPLAEVHHGFAENRLRRTDRVPRDLFDIGASWAVLQRKHVPEAERAPQWRRLRAQERARLVRHLVAGGLEPRDLRRLLRRLDAGHAEGQKRAFGTARLAGHPEAPFHPFPSACRKSLWMPTRPWSARRDGRRAAELVAAGHVVTLVNLSLTAFFHRVRFGPDGVWHHNGGVFGRSDRHQPLIALHRRAERLKFERIRVAIQRGLSDSERRGSDPKFEQFYLP